MEKKHVDLTLEEIAVILQALNCFEIDCQEKMNEMHTKILECIDDFKVGSFLIASGDIIIIKDLRKKIIKVL